jgi:ABC-type nitrate/sulfonate/bicarbonate transport system substrate-binding protein
MVEKQRASMSRRHALGVLGSALAASTVRPRRATAATKIQVGYLPVISCTPIYLEAAQPWAGGNLEVEPLRLQAGPAIAQAIQSGSIPAGEIACTVALSLASRGIPIVALASANVITRKYPYNRIMVPAGSTLHSVAELKDKTVGVLGIGTIDHLELLMALHVAKMSASDVKVVTIPVPTQPQVLASGQVDAMMMPPPADAVAEIQFGARMLADATDSLPYIPLEYLVADARWVERNPAIVQELVSGWIKACRWMTANREAARASAARALNLAPEIAAKARLPYWQANGLPIMPGVWNLYYAMTETKLIDPVADPEAMMQRYFIEPTTNYVLPALKALGRVPDAEADGLEHLGLPYLAKPPEDYFAAWEKA